MEQKKSFIYWMVFILIIGTFFIILGYNIILSSSDFTLFSVPTVKVSLKAPKVKAPKVKLPEIKNIERRAVLSLSPQEGEYQAGAIFPVNILLDTQGFEVDGFDVFLKYDPAILQISGEEGNYIKEGNIFNGLLGEEVDKQTGLIKFSALSDPLKKFQGEGKVATIKFKVLEKGAARIFFVFDLGLNTDSNVSKDGEDVLLSVENGEYIIRE